VADMPFMSYQESADLALHNAGRFMKEANAEAVKLEGGQVICTTVERLVAVGIPVMGHLGFTPQSVHEFGGYGVRGKQEAEARRMLADARALADAGAFAIVLEKVPSQLACEITEAIPIPTIGIGAGSDCDGQILVSYDMLGLYDKMKIKFVRHYAEMGKEVRDSVGRYCQDVRDGSFPGEEESYS